MADAKRAWWEKGATFVLLDSIDILFGSMGLLVFWRLIVEDWGAPAMTFWKALHIVLIVHVMTCFVTGLVTTRMDVRKM